MLCYDESMGTCIDENKTKCIQRTNYLIPYQLSSGLVIANGFLFAYLFPFFCTQNEYSVNFTAVPWWSERVRVRVLLIEYENVLKKERILFYVQKYKIKFKLILHFLKSKCYWKKNITWSRRLRNKIDFIDIGKITSFVF